MLAYLCLLAFIGLGKCSEIEKIMPTRHEIEKSINRTIEEVEKMIQENPALPKLSRNDIVNILYNITSSDMLTIEDQALEAIQKSRADYQRALMVVLPYNIEDSEENLKDLYTKPPMVQLVADEESDSGKDTKFKFAYNPNLYSTNNVQQSDNLIENKHQLVTAHMRFEESDKISTTENSYVKEMETTTIGTTEKPLIKKTSEPHKFSFNLEDFDKKVETSHTSIATKRPIYKGTFSRYRTSTIKPPKLEIIYSSTAETKTTTEASPKLETTSVPNKSAQSVLSSDQWHYNASPTSATIKTIKPDTSPWKPMMPTKGYFLPTVESAELDEPNFSIIKMEDFEKVMETTTTARPRPIFVTPSAVTNEKQEHYKFKSNPTEQIPITTTSTPIHNTTTTTTTTTTILPTPMRKEVEQLLKSIGLQPMKINKQENNSKLNQNNIQSQLNAYLNKLQDPKFETINTDLSTLIKHNIFEAPRPSVKDGVKNLSPDIQLLFQQLGLQMPKQEEKLKTTTTIKPITTHSIMNSYTNFKPLPTSSVKDKDFRNFLARFGLGVGENRNKKSMNPKPVTKKPSLIEAVPDNMKNILENIGLIKRTPKVPEPEIDFEFQTEASDIVESTTPLNEHIFKPHEISVSDKEQKEKIKNLLNTVRKVQEGKANIQDVQKVAHDLLQSTKSLGNGPDPLKLEEILQNYRDSLKNDVKRQQEQTTISPTLTEDENLLSSMAINASSNLKASTLANDGSSKTGQSSSSFSTDDSVSNSATTVPTPTSSTAKPNFFDTFDINDYINLTAIEDSPKNPNTSISDLEDSFGGSTSKPDPVIPTRPKTGLYFLLDWNSFLEVGEDGKEKVNLRFQPKVGDRTRFISVTVP